jgi:serine/threonine protein phosphatase PrpC
VRNNHQDSFAVRPDLGLFVVADGVANQPAGGLAAALAVRAGMVTTLAALVMVRDRVVVAHTGDSRIYRVRRRDIEFRNSRFKRGKGSLGGRGGAFKG